MSLNEAEAIDVARRFAATHSSYGWREDSIDVRRETIAGRDCWAVFTRYEHQPGEPDWMFEIDGDVIYYIAIATGKCIALGGTPGAPRMLPD